MDAEVSANTVKQGDEGGDAKGIKQENGGGGGSGDAAVGKEQECGSEEKIKEEGDGSSSADVTLNNMKEEGGAGIAAAMKTEDSAAPLAVLRGVDSKREDGAGVLAKQEEGGGDATAVVKNETPRPVAVVKAEAKGGKEEEGGGDTVEGGNDTKNSGEETRHMPTIFSIVVKSVRIHPARNFIHIPVISCVRTPICAMVCCQRPCQYPYVAPTRTHALIFRVWNCCWNDGVFERCFG